MWFHCITFLVIIAAVTAEECPDNKGTILARGIKKNADLIVQRHNYYREQIALRNVTGQPRGINLNRMSYDKILGKKARAVSNQCEFNHVLADDDRFENGFVGQNIFSQRSDERTDDQDWEDAVAAWFKENEDYNYPDDWGQHTGHYTQVVWADTYLVGCDFIFYYDNDNTEKPYTKLYTCNYGPGGNQKGEAPYKTGRSGCKHLCKPKI